MPMPKRLKAKILKNKTTAQIDIQMRLHDYLTYIVFMMLKIITFDYET